MTLEIWKTTTWIGLCFIEDMERCSALDH